MRRPPETVYAGERLTTPLGTLRVRVTMDRVPLSPVPSRLIWSHSPAGFEWGYGGSGPAQLALALLFDATGDKDLALKSYQWFKWAVVSQWGDRWALTAAEIFTWLDRWAKEDPEAQDRFGEDNDDGEGEGEGDTPLIIKPEEGGGS